MSPGQIVVFVIGTIVILCGAYYATYYVGIKSTNLRRGAGRSIVLRDRFSISKDKSFCLVEIYGKIYIVGVTNHAMTLLDTFDVEHAAEYERQKEQQMTGVVGLQGAIAGKFMSWLTTVVAKKRGDKAKNGAVSAAFAEKLKAAVDEDLREKEKSDEQDRSGTEACNPEERE